MPATKEQIVITLRQAYNMEIETVINYLANSLHLEGVRADFIKQALATDIQEELGHAQQLGNRIKQLGGSIPGSLQLKMTQRSPGTAGRHNRRGSRHPRRHPGGGRSDQPLPLHHQADRWGRLRHARPSHHHPRPGGGAPAAV